MAKELEMQTGETKKKKDKKPNYKLKGDYMKPFTSFYDPKSLEACLTSSENKAVENKIFGEIESALKQVRSSRNLNCKIKKSNIIS